MLSDTVGVLYCKYKWNKKWMTEQQNHIDSIRKAKISVCVCMLDIQDHLRCLDIDVQVCSLHWSLNVKVN